MPKFFQGYKTPSDCADEDKQFCVQKYQSGKLTLAHSHAYYYQVRLQMAASSTKYCAFPNRRLIEAKKKRGEAAKNKGANVQMRKY